MWWMYIIVIIAGYLIGGIQSAYIVGKLKGIDIREHGSHNAGASNVFSVIGWKYGVLVGLSDILKATIPVFIITKIAPNQPILAIACGSAVVLGHIFPLFLNFKGGKGTASIVGMTLGLNPILFVIVGLTIVIVTFISDYIAVGTLALLIALLISVYLMDYGFIALGILLVISIINISKHMENFIRISKKEEDSVKGVFKKIGKSSD